MTRFLTFIASLFIRALHATLRVRHVRVENLERLPQYIIAFWHAHLLMMVRCRFRRPISVMISQSKDGELIAGTMAWFGVDSARGSSSRNSLGAMREMIRTAKGGTNLVFTPDGPRGPSRVASEGVVYAAQLTGLPIVPIAFNAKKKKLLRSWDRFLVPHLFSKAIFVYGEPITIARDEPIEAARVRVENALNELERESEERFDELWDE